MISARDINYIYSLKNRLSTAMRCLSKEENKKFITVFILLLLLTTTLIRGQDTSSVYSQLDELTQRVDSLESLLKKINMDSLKSSNSLVEKIEISTDTSDTDDLLSKLTSLFSFNEQDQSSKRNRVNQLLQALQKQPGKITFNGDATSILHWKTGNSHFTNGSGSFDLFAFVGFGNNTNLFINLEAVGGNGLNERINSFASLNEDAGSLQDNEGRDLLHVLEAWMEFNFFSDWIKVTIGKIDLTNYFDVNDAANDETMQFLSGPFVNSAAFPVPSNSPGLRTRVGIENLITFQLGLASSDNSGSDLFTGLFKIIGTELNADLGGGYYGKIHFFAYKDGVFRDASGYGFSFAGTVADRFKLFGRWNENNNNYSKEINTRDFWSIGLEFNSNIFNREVVVGAAFGELNPFQNRLLNEQVVETYIRFQLNNWIYFSPHLQVIHNTAGSSENHLLVAVRTQINF